MSIIKGRRSYFSIVKGIYIRILSLMAYFSFPYQITVALHKLRGVKIGKKTHISRFVYIDDRNPNLIDIGDGVAICTGVMILAHQRDLRYATRGRYVMDCPFKEGRVIINSGAHIGIGAIIMPGVTIGEGAVIGAGSVVTRDILAYSIAYGSPAKIFRVIE